MCLLYLATDQSPVTTGTATHDSVWLCMTGTCGRMQLPWSPTNTARQAASNSHDQLRQQSERRSSCNRMAEIVSWLLVTCWQGGQADNWHCQRHSLPELLVGVIEDVSCRVDITEALW